VADKLYSSKDLLKGYVAGRPQSYVETWDFRRFVAFTKSGGPEPKDLKEAIRQATHDAQISHALRKYLRRDRPEGETPKLVGIMGGHGVLRTDQAFKVIADVARDLTKHGYLVVSGGGPGAMEAAHFGAYFVGSTERAYAAALAELQTVPRLADLSPILNKDGSFAADQEETIKKGYQWLTAALSAREMADGERGVSLAIPTWLYGAEPTTPFASAYAKYFQNSIREETLITEGRAGVLYAQGGGGTLREIFQDVELNFYVKTAEAFTPMIFVDPGHFWERDALYGSDGRVVTSGIKLDVTISEIFKMALNPAIRADCAAKVKFTTDPDTVRDVLDGHAPVAQEKLGMLLEGVSATLIAAKGRR
jgi:predicted Rossmann-fold nucleotide-binding protein